MFSVDKLSAAATITATAVLVAMWLCKDAVLATMKPALVSGQWGRNRFLRLIGREEYVGFHRYRRAAA
jgi:hypothetical protein